MSTYNPCLVTYQQIHEYDSHKQQEEADEYKRSFWERVERVVSRCAILANRVDKGVFKVNLSDSHHQDHD